MLMGSPAPVYQDYSGCPEPPLPPLPEASPFESFLECFAPKGVHSDTLTMRCLRILYRVSGYEAFHASLTRSLGDRLKWTHMRMSTCGPLQNATTALCDAATHTSPAVRAAALVAAYLDFKTALYAGDVPADGVNGHANEMRQYVNLFGTCVAFDGSSFRLFRNVDSRTVSILANRRIYVASLPDVGGAALIATIAELLDAVWNDSRARPVPSEVITIPLLSSSSDATQLRLFRELWARPGNAGSLSTLRDTLLTVCLDFGYEPGSYAEAARIAHSGNCANRWHQSALQMVVFGNSRACLVFNWAAYLDGDVMIRASAEIQRRADRLMLSRPSPLMPAGGELKVHGRELAWDLRGLELSAVSRDVMRIVDHQPSTFEITDCGRRPFQHCGLRPVESFVAALALTIARLSRRPAQVSQYVSLSRYRYMDVTKVALDTEELQDFVREWPNTSAGGPRHVLLTAAIESQRRECRRARSALPPSHLGSLFMATKGRRGRAAIMAATSGILRLRRLRVKNLRLFQQWITISHPRVCAEVPVVGRPGVRLPNQQMFALHYQMFEDRTVVTVIPGTNWNVPNVEFVAELESRLKEILSTAAAVPPEASR